MPIKYQVELPSSARRELESLKNPLRERVLSCLSILSDNPRPVGCTKLVGSKSLYRYRVGDYRIVYEIIDNERLVVIYRISHRRDVYKRP